MRSSKTKPKDITFNRWVMKLGKLCNAVHSYKGRCKSLRYKSHGACVQCYRDYRADLYQRTKANRDAVSARWREKNPEKVKAIRKRANKAYHEKKRLRMKNKEMP